MKTAWLRDLEEKVQDASERLGDLRGQNEELQKREAELQERVGELEAQVAELQGRLESAPDAKEVAGWTEERADVRQRVEKLVDHLGELLES